jgi:hypothetical protein
VAAQSQTHGTQLVIWNCKSAGANTDQLWLFKNSQQTQNCTIFLNVNSNLVMGVAAASTLPGAAVIQWEYLVGHPDQEWCNSPAPVN